MLTIKIRKNRDSVTDHDKWRVIVHWPDKQEPEEVHVAGVIIKGCTVYTQAEVVPSGDIKYNICVNARGIRFNKGVAFIK